MSNLPHIIGDAGTLFLNFFRYAASARQDGVAWLAVTLALSTILAAGYCVIGVNWYFQRKLARQADSRAAMRRLCLILGCCAACSALFYVTDVPWLIWRFYDFALAVFAFNTWAFIHRQRGLSLVDERLAQVAELERSAMRYREIAELLPHMVWTANAHGQIDFSNHRWHEYVGGGGRGGDERTWLDAVHPEDRFRVLNAWNRAVAKRAPVSFEARLDGGAVMGYRTFVIRATPVVQGQALKWLGGCADIEDQKLLAAEKEAQARQKSFFLNALSHDLRAPLHNVLLNAQLLKMSQQAGEAVDLEALEMIRENAVAAGDLVARLLDFAKVGAQEHNVVERVALPQTLHQIARRFQPLAEQKGLHVRVLAPPDAPGQEAADMHVATDRQKLERIVSNLLDNAIKYTARGGVTLELLPAAAPSTAAARDTRDTRDTRDADAHPEVRLRIRDTGIGIPTDKVPYLFDEFYQVNNYERDRSKGFGMGLAICRSLARHIGADVRLAATGSEGSCFEIVIPKNVNGGVNADVGGGADSNRDDAITVSAADDNDSSPPAASGAPVRTDRRRRPLGPPGDCDDPEAAGVCRI
jgi:signal transduction histidine kinase